MNATTSDPEFLRVRGLRLEVESSGAAIIKDLSFDVKRGEFLAVVGESGSGKTMAARAILGLLPTGIHRTAGQIHLDGEDIAQAKPNRLKALRGVHIGMVFQEPMVSLNPAHRIGEQMAEGLRLHTNLSTSKIRQRCVQMLERVQIRDPERCLGAFPHEFSGGMRQRIMLASVMLLKPGLLIVDEPTTALDTLTQREVLDLMVELAREEGTAVLLITHNLGLVARYAQRVLVLRQGVLIETGTVGEVLHAPTDAYTRELVAALPRRTPTTPGKAAGAPVLQVKGLSVIYPGTRSGLFSRHPQQQAVFPTDLDIHAGETVAVVGGSGSGKTTLGRAMLRLVPAAGGEVLFGGKNILQADQAGVHRFRMACQLVFQDPYSSLNPRMRIGDIVAEPLRHVDGLSGRDAARRVEEVVDEVGLATLVRRFPHELSGGQRQRVAIARTLVRRPAFVVADEPVSALDMTIQAQVLALFHDLQKHHGFACMFISHDLGAVEQIADRVIVMSGGRIVEQGSRDAVFDAPKHCYTKALLAAAPVL